MAGDGSDDAHALAVSIPFSLDLVAASKKQLFFLKEVNKYPDLYEGPLVKEAIRR